MAGQPAVGQAFQWYREGQHARALEAARRLLEADPSDVNALHVAGLASARLGDAAGALDLLARATALAPATLPLWLSRGKLLDEAGRPGEAREAFVRAARLDPASYHAHLELGLLDAKLARVREAARSLLRAWRLRAGDVHAPRELFDLLLGHPGEFAAAPAPLPAPTDRPAVSVVMCSVDPAKFAAASASFARAFGGWDHEIVVFSHDDVEILSADLGGALARAVERADVVGVIGTAKLTGPAWGWAGREPARGRIVQPAREGEGWELLAFGAPCALEAGLEALDGVFLAARRGQAISVGFDEAAFDGFHLYDLDFTYRAARQGLRVAVTPEILLRHDSHGSFDGPWKAYAQKFVAKFPGLAGPSKPDFAPARLAFATAGEAADLSARLDALCREERS